MTRRTAHSIRDSGRAGAEYVYEVGPVAFPPAKAGDFATNGVADLLALSDHQFIAIERWGATAKSVCEAVALNEKHEWIYRGQIIPTDREVTVEAVVTVGGVAPSDEPDLDWVDGMGPENVEEFEFARRGGAELEAIPDMDLALNMTPVCDVARAIVRLSNQADSTGRVYHLLSGQELTLHDLGPVLEELGLRPSYLSIDAWAAHARDKLHADADDNLLALLAILSKYDRAAQRPHIVGDATRAALEALGAPIARVNRALLVRYLKNLGVHGPSVVLS